MVIIRIPFFLIIGHRKVEMKAKLRRILYHDIPPRSAAIFNVLKMLIAMVIDGDYVMVRDVIYCSRFFQNWHSPELITVLPTISKILEKAVYVQLYAYLKNNEIITSKQFVFRPKVSTGTALAHFTDNILFVGAVFLDLSKALDTVDHHLLLRKLMNIGLASSTTQWFRSYLTNRSQITSVGDALSSASEMPVGVPKAVYWDLYCF